MTKKKKKIVQTSCGNTGEIYSWKTSWNFKHSSPPVYILGGLYWETLFYNLRTIDNSCRHTGKLYSWTPNSNNKRKALDLPIVLPWCYIASHESHSTLKTSQNYSLVWRLESKHFHKVKNSGLLPYLQSFVRKCWDIKFLYFYYFLDNSSSDNYMFSVIVNQKKPVMILNFFYICEEKPSFQG